MLSSFVNYTVEIKFVHLSIIPVLKFWFWRNIGSILLRTTFKIVVMYDC
jgi:hypothetical protein